MRRHLRLLPQDAVPAPGDPVQVVSILHGDAVTVTPTLDGAIALVVDDVEQSPLPTAMLTSNEATNVAMALLRAVKVNASRFRPRDA